VSAVAYAALVGRYIRMERPATEAELAAAPDMRTIGMECVVLAVRDRIADGEEVVEILADYGYGFDVRPGERWQFTVWPDEAARKSWRHL
jgi:hypothetical protein